MDHLSKGLWNKKLSSSSWACLSALCSLMITGQIGFTINNRLTHGLVDGTSDNQQNRKTRRLWLMERLTIPEGFNFYLPEGFDQQHKEPRTIRLEGVNVPALKNEGIESTVHHLFGNMILRNKDANITEKTLYERSISGPSQRWEEAKNGP